MSSINVARKGLKTADRLGSRNAGQACCRRLVGSIGRKLDYKAASAGVEFVRVDPRGTSQQCPSVGR